MTDRNQEYDYARSIADTCVSIIVTVLWIYIYITARDNLMIRVAQVNWRFGYALYPNIASKEQEKYRKEFKVFLRKGLKYHRTVQYYLFILFAVVPWSIINVRRWIDTIRGEISDTTNQTIDNYWFDHTSKQWEIPYVIFNSIGDLINFGTVFICYSIASSAFSVVVAQQNTLIQHVKKSNEEDRVFIEQQQQQQQNLKNNNLNNKNDQKNNEKESYIEDIELDTYSHNETGISFFTLLYF